MADEIEQPFAWQGNEPSNQNNGFVWKDEDEVKKGNSFSGVFNYDEPPKPGATPVAVGNTGGKPMSTDELAKILPSMTPADMAARKALAAKNSANPSPETMGAIPTFAGSMANWGLFGATPYVAAALPGGELGSLPFNERVKYYKSAQASAEKEHPTSANTGAGAGLLTSLPFYGTKALSAIGAVKSAAAQGALSGLTQGGSGLEDWISDKADASAPLIQAGIGAGIGVGAQGLLSKINPVKIQDAAQYAYNLGVPIAAEMMNAGKKGFEYLAPKAEQTVNAISQGFNKLTGGTTAEQAGQAMLNTFGSAKNMASGIENAIYAPVRQFGLLQNPTEFAPSNMVVRLNNYMAEHAPTIPQNAKDYINDQLKTALSSTQNQSGLTLNQMRNLSGVIWSAAENIPQGISKEVEGGLKHIWGGLRDDMRDAAHLVGQQTAATQNSTIGAAKQFGQQAADAFDKANEAYGYAQSHLMSLKGAGSDTDPSKVFGTLRDMAYHAPGARYLSILKDALGPDSPEWKTFQNGLLHHIGGEGSFSFGNFTNRLANMVPEARSALLAGRNDARGFVRNLTGLAKNTMDEGENLFDRAVARGQSSRQAIPSTSGAVWDLTKKVFRSPATYIGGASHLVGGASIIPATALAGIAFAAQKAAQATNRALGSRNVAQSPTVRNVVDQGVNVARRGVTTALTKATKDVPTAVHSGLQNFTKSTFTKPAYKWYSEHMPWVLGGRAEGGRTAYRAGGKVGSIEPLVQALMVKAKRAKKVSNKATEPLLNEHDNSIARALAVAQKSI